MSGEVVKSVAEDATGRIWLMDQAGLESFEPAAKPRVALDQAHEVGWSVFCDATGKIWMGDYAGNIIYQEKGQWTPLPTGGATARRPITVFFQEPGAGMWVGTENGLWRISGNRLSREMLPTDAKQSPVQAMAYDRESRLWLGLNGGGLWYKKDGGWIPVAEMATLPVSRVSALVAARNGSLWVGTSGSGLFRYRDGKLFRFDSERTTLPRYIGSIVEDDEGYLWLGSADGIFRAKQSDLDRMASGEEAEVTPSRYTRADGLGISECATAVQPCAWRAHDGRLWFATRKGVSVVDPHELTPDSQPPPVLIEEAILWGRAKKTIPVARDAIRAAAKTLSPMRMASDTRIIEIHYTAPSFGAPERVRFRYRIESMDARWVDAGQRRIAYYQGLAPGTYRFQVSACTQDGVWNDSGAVLAFTLEPHFWQTMWFRILAMAGIAGLAGLAYRIRVAQIEAVNKVRFRLAGDLHDEIGANLGSIGLNAELLQQDPALSLKQRDELSALHRLAGQTIQSVRDLVWFINPDFDNTTDMLRRMKDVAGLLLAGREWHFDATNVAPNRPLSPDFRRNVFFIFKEALHNSAKHSKAPKVDVAVREVDDGLEVAVTDNGLGMKASGGGFGHGLKSMRRRAAEADGAIEITSISGQGTKVVFRAPFQRRRRRWVWRK
jgi:signal transduction histidine kinase